MSGQSGPSGAGQPSSVIAQSVADKEAMLEGPEQTWDRALRQGLARLEQYRIPGGTDFVFG